VEPNAYPKEFFSVKYFSNKLKGFLQAVNADSTFLMYDYSRVCLFFYIGQYLPLQKFRLSMSVCLSICLSPVIMYSSNCLFAKFC